RKVEVELPGEGGVGLLVVEAGPQDLHVPVLVLLDAVAEPATLGRSAGGVRLGEEPEDDVLPAVVGEAADLAGVVLDRGLGGGGAGRGHGASLPPGLWPSSRVLTPAAEIV